MSTVATKRPTDLGPMASPWRSLAALRAGVTAGAISGAVVGGVGGRLVMRIVALIDPSAAGVRTDFGATVGEVTAGGTITLMILTTLAGTIGGVLYIALRRWLPWSGVGRGLTFGVLIVFGPGVIAIGETDLQIFEPALPIFGMFAALELLFGAAVALVADRLRPTLPVRRGRRLAMLLRALHCVAAAAVCVFAVMFAMNIIAGEGSCLTAGPEGGCAVRIER